LLQIARIVTFVEKLLTDEDDTCAAQLHTLSGQRFGHLLFAVLDERDSVAFEAETQPVPFSVVNANSEVDLKRRTPGALVFFFAVHERDSFADGDDQLLVTGVVVDGEEDRIDTLRRPQRCHYA